MLEFILRSALAPQTCRTVGVENGYCLNIHLVGARDRCVFPDVFVHHQPLKKEVRAFVYIFLETGRVHLLGLPLLGSYIYNVVLRRYTVRRLFLPDNMV